ncbi:MAG: hypothetical protein P1U82_25195, partial [Verrucomicrobiales bacterium]|nr:hypothetical protein [Verrucomicrobiales bacterium]
RSFDPSILRSFDPALRHSGTPALRHSGTPSTLRALAIGGPRGGLGGCGQDDNMEPPKLPASNHLEQNTNKTNTNI